jgi:heme oxygenase (mycobilin-producing)
MEAEGKAVFRARPHRIDRTTGFVRREVLYPLDRPQEIWLMTHWRSAEDYRTSHCGQAAGRRTAAF